MKSGGNHIQINEENTKRFKKKHGSILLNDNSDDQNFEISFNPLCNAWYDKIEAAREHKKNNRSGIVSPIAKIIKGERNSESNNMEAGKIINRMVKTDFKKIKEYY